MTAIADDRSTTLGPRLLVGDFSRRESLSEYLARGGYHHHSWDLTPAELRSVVANSGLRGRGGSAFPTGRKLERVAGQTGPKTVLINAAESEPGSYKDRLLLAHRPHIVIEGALLAARAVGADDAVFYVHQGDENIRVTIDTALNELQTMHQFPVTWRVIEAPDRYVSGEETSAIRRVNGGPALPTLKPPLPADRGVRDRPTLVQNVETLTNLPQIAQRGSDWFRLLGSDDLPGTMLITLSGSVSRPGVYEVPTGARLDEIVNELGGGTDDARPIQALLPGGFFSGWISGEAVRGGARLNRENLARFGASPGSGAISVVSTGVCGLWQAVRLLRFFADESARQCGVCVSGSAEMTGALERVALGEARHDDLKRLRRWSTETLPGRGACSHLDGAAIAARTAIHVFQNEIAEHTRLGTCGRPVRIVLPGLDARGLNVNVNNNQRRPVARADQPGALRKVRVLQ